jgi:hypothetical protein
MLGGQIINYDDTPREMLGGQIINYDTLFVIQHLRRVEASVLCGAWWPSYSHSLFSFHLKMTIATFRMATWYMAARVEGSGSMVAEPACAINTLPWLVLSYAMPRIGLGWMAPGWLAL